MLTPVLPGEGPIDGTLEVRIDIVLVDDVAPAVLVVDDALLDVPALVAEAIIGAGVAGDTCTFTTAGKSPLATPAGPPLNVLSAGGRGGGDSTAAGTALPVALPVAGEDAALLLSGDGCAGFEPAPG